MGTRSTSETNNLTLTLHELESENCPLNSNARNSDKVTESQSESTRHQIRQRKCKCGTIPLVASGLIFLTMGILSAKFTITDLILTERIKMRPWFLPYSLWLNPQPEVRLNVYIFTVENADEFLSGVDSKIKMKEFGPIVYSERLQHRDVVHHDNSTLSYTAVRSARFLPHANKLGILNETITVPNLSLLSAASFVNEDNYLIQIAFNYLHRRYSDGLFINTTVYDYLWNYKSKLIHKINDLVPSMVPLLNYGILHGVYDHGPDRYNVKIGTKYGDTEFFQINTVNGAPTVPGYNIEKGDCYASVANSTEGVMYRQRITKGSVLTFWRRALCRSADLHFEKEMQLHDTLGYKFTLGSDAYDRAPNNRTDCYKGTYGMLPNGLSDIAKCYFNFPFAISQPHFYGRSKGFTRKFQGLNAIEENHSSFAIVEPMLGVPMKQHARSQVNLVIPKFTSFFKKDYQVFSDMVLPLFWVEFLQEGLTAEVLSLVSFVANVLPIFETALTCTLCLVGFGLTLTAFVKSFNSKWKYSSKQITYQFVLRRSKSVSNIGA